jgi:hypothetical protein
VGGVRDTTENVLRFLELLSCDQKYVERETQAAQAAAKPDVLLNGMGRRRGDDEEINVAVTCQLAGGCRAEEMIRSGWVTPNRRRTISRTKLSSIPITHMIWELCQELHPLSTCAPSSKMGAHRVATQDGR